MSDNPFFISSGTEEHAVEKVEAASRQLTTAIELWFHRKDTVSIHTLAAAAHQIVHDVMTKKHKVGLLFGESIERSEGAKAANWSKEDRKKFVRWMTRPASFFKHADFRKNKAGTITFDPELSEAFMMATIIGLMMLGKELTDTQSAFYLWNAIHRPRMLSEKARKAMSESIHVDALRSERRQKFLNIVLLTNRRLRRAQRAKS